MTTESGKNSNAKPARQHRATYARDKKKGGYLVRVSGPHANAFAGRKVPVSTLRGEEHEEELDALIWSGIDTGEYGGTPGEPIALYSFKPSPRDDSDDVPF